MKARKSLVSIEFQLYHSEFITAVNVSAADREVPLIAGLVMQPCSFQALFFSPASHVHQCLSNAKCLPAYPFPIA